MGVRQFLSRADDAVQETKSAISTGVVLSVAAILVAVVAILVAVVKR